MGGMTHPRYRRSPAEWWPRGSAPMRTWDVAALIVGDGARPGRESFSTTRAGYRALQFRIERELKEMGPIESLGLAVDGSSLGLAPKKEGDD
jgi:hypothetical protein